MLVHFLFPHRYRLIGWILLVPFMVLGFLTLYNEFEFGFLDVALRSAENSDWLDKPEIENFTNEIAMIGTLVALMFIAFAKEKVEDEYILKLRLDSLLVAVFVNYILLLLAILFIYGLDFVEFLVYNMYTVLILFIIRFTWVKYRQSKMVEA